MTWDTPLDYNGNLLKQNLTIPLRAIEIEGGEGRIVRAEVWPPHTEGRPHGR